MGFDFGGASDLLLFLPLSCSPASFTSFFASPLSPFEADLVFDLGRTLGLGSCMR